MVIAISMVICDLGMAWLGYRPRPNHNIPNRATCQRISVILGYDFGLDTDPDEEGHTKLGKDGVKALIRFHVRFQPSPALPCPSPKPVVSLHEHIRRELREGVSHYH
jgi:hypothetical protein